MMKLSDYMVQFFEKKGIQHVFGYPGGMITHLIESLSHSSTILTHLAYHEQAAAFEAVGYAKSSNKPVVVFTSSGPGATNLITGICDAWFDSVPVIFITGNVNTYESRKGYAVRQKGFQETDIVSMVKGVTKFSCYLDDSNDIQYILEAAFDIAFSGRPGPCLIDIPMDITRAEIVVERLRHYTSCPCKKADDVENAVKFVKEALLKSERPVLLIGNGVHIAGIEKEVYKLVERLRIPVVTSLPAVDMLGDCGSLANGFIGAYGSRAANIILEKSDLIIGLGSRFDNRQTGTDVGWFATNAELIRFDIDENELELNVKEDEKHFLCSLQDVIRVLMNVRFTKRYSSWEKVCQEIHAKLEGFDDNVQLNFLSQFIEKMPAEVIYTTDVGQNQIWVAQAIGINKKCRILFSAGLGAMGFSLPAAIGAHLATGKPVVCFTGDGGLQMNIQELQFVVREKLPIKIVVLNNESLGMIRHFQEMYFENNNFMTIETRGYSSPDFVKIAQAYGIPAEKFEMNEVEEAAEFIKTNSACLINVFLGNVTYLTPKSIYNKPLAYQMPKLPDYLQKELMSL